MTFDRNLWRRQKRRERGVGSHAPNDSSLDLATLQSVGGFDSLWALADRLGLSHERMKKAVERGLTVWTADRYANALGFHPQEVWGEAWWEAGARYEALDAISEAG